MAGDNLYSTTKARDLRITEKDVPGRPDLIIQSFGAPLTPVVTSCLWERAVYAPEWLENVNSAGTAMGVGTAVVTRERVVSRLRVTPQHQQPAGLLHGGVTALIAEEMGSTATAMNTPNRQPIVGININATHLAGAQIGQMVLLICSPVKRGGNLQVWRIDAYLDEEQEDVSARLAQDPTYYLHCTPAGRLLATCQLTAVGKPNKSGAKTQVKSKL